MNTIGRYRVLAPVWRGGQGRVCLGYDAQLQRPVAIKRYSLPVSPGQQRAMLEEARTLARIDSPRVVKIYDLVHTDREVALITEWISGATLDVRVARGPMPLGEVLTVADDVAAALGAVARAGRVHGDIKAGNVLLTRGGRARLVDFGVVQSLSPPRTAARGSPAAVCPEQLRGEPAGIASDLFALGCLLYRMISGRHPFIAGGEVQTKSLLWGAAPPLPAVTGDLMPLPPGLDALIQRLLRAYPEQRYQSVWPVREILHWLRKGLPPSGGAV